MNGWRRFALRWGIFLILLAFMALLALLNPNFLTLQNLRNVGTQVAPLAVIAVGTTLVILLAEIDLSVGSVAALCGALAATVLELGGQGPGWVLLAFVSGLGTGALIGLLNGALTVFGGIPSFIVTLGMLSIARGVTLLVTGGRPLFGLGEGFGALAYGGLPGLPMPIVLLAALYGAAALWLHGTQLGRYLYAVGANMRAVELAGVAVRRIKLGVFALAGALAGLGGMMVAARLDSAQPTAASGWELDAIAAVVLGGTSLYGGRGSVIRTLAGAILLQFISNGLNLIGVPAYWQQISKGGIIIVALLAERSLRRGER